MSCDGPGDVRPENFGVWDTSRDGFIDQNEFGIGFNGLGWDDDFGAFGAFDDDGNSLLSNSEFFGDDDFDMWDSDRGGFLDMNEWGI